jgi:hypothetical protein
MPSSVILAMRYQPDERELVIVFRGRGAYRYFDVAMEEWREFLEAGSKGTYLNEVFKPREHRYEKLMVWAGAERTEAGEALEWGETWALRRKGVGRVEVTEREAKTTA